MAFSDIIITLCCSYLCNVFNLRISHTDITFIKNSMPMMYRKIFFYCYIEHRNDAHTHRGRHTCIHTHSLHFFLFDKHFSYYCNYQVQCCRLVLGLDLSYQNRFIFQHKPFLSLTAGIRILYHPGVVYVCRYFICEIVCNFIFHSFT